MVGRYLWICWDLSLLLPLISTPSMTANYLCRSYISCFLLQVSVICMLLCCNYHRTAGLILLIFPDSFFFFFFFFCCLLYPPTFWSLVSLNCIWFRHCSSPQQAFNSSGFPQQATFTRPKWCSSARQFSKISVCWNEAPVLPKPAQRDLCVCSPMAQSALRAEIRRQGEPVD